MKVGVVVSTRCFLAVAGEYPVACGGSARAAVRAGSTALLAAYALGTPVVESQGLHAGVSVVELARGRCPCAMAGVNMRGGEEAIGAASDALERMGVLEPEGCGCAPEAVL